MKTRNGFVSNSSSASFIIHWRMKSMGEKVTLNGALSQLYGFYTYDPSTDKVNWINEDNDYHKNVFQNIIENTKENYDNSFTTNFFTSMLNTYDDFGDTAKSLIIGLLADDRFDIINTLTNKD